jgi:uncharacterized protein YdeI (YjbR/CyaY-like superfamily)
MRGTLTPARLFESPRDWAAWLEKNHRGSPGIWLRLAKMGSQLRSVSYQEAVEIALCYGWIDGQKKPESDDGMQPTIRPTEPPYRPIFKRLWTPAQRHRNFSKR